MSYESKTREETALRQAQVIGVPETENLAVTGSSMGRSYSAWGKKAALWTGFILGTGALLAGVGLTVAKYIKPYPTGAILGGVGLVVGGLGAYGIWKQYHPTESKGLAKRVPNAARGAKRHARRAKPIRAVKETQAWSSIVRTVNEPLTPKGGKPPKRLTKEEPVPPRGTGAVASSRAARRAARQTPIERRVTQQPSLGTKLQRTQTYSTRPPVETAHQVEEDRSSAIPVSERSVSPKGRPLHEARPTAVAPMPAAIPADSLAYRLQARLGQVEAAKDPAARAALRAERNALVKQIPAEKRRLAHQADQARDREKLDSQLAQLLNVETEMQQELARDKRALLEEWRGTNLPKPVKEDVRALANWPLTEQWGHLNHVGRPAPDTDPRKQLFELVDAEITAWPPT
jgi:hypothetical protein